MGAIDDLAADLRRLLGGTIEELRRLSGGASRETWSFRLDGRLLILQRQRPGGDTSSSMPNEAAAVRAAGAAGLPVPAIVLDATGEDRPLGLPAVVVEYVPGESIARKLLRDDEYGEVRPRLPEECGRILAGIHRLPIDVLAGDPVLDPLPGLQATMDSFGTAHPAFELAFRWLERHRPAASSGAPCIVHGDFRTGNLLVTPQGVSAVLDWEIVHLGDPLEDLGWFCVRAWRFGSDDKPAGGFGSREELWRGYEAGGGGPVDPEAARWWEIYGTLRWGVICLMQAAAHRLGFSRSVELATIGWRACENEYDVLCLLAPDREPPSPTPAEPRGGRDTADLVEAVREWVAGDVSDATEGRVRFHARVATNALSMIERAIRLGPDLDAAHADRLARLGFPDDAALAAAIRAGELDDRWDDVLDELWSASRDALAISHPGYDERRP